MNWKYKLVILSAVLILGGWWTYLSSLPWLQQHLSNQHTVDPLTLTESFELDDKVGIWWGKTAKPYQLAENPELIDQRVLGTDTSSKRIEVDLTNQRLYAYENENQVYNFPISSGLFDWTPRGEFNIWIKLKATKMEGGNRALRTYYNLPNVPYVMYFSNADIPAWRGFGLHGAYWHNDFGRPKSHGCVNLRPEDAQLLYYWAEPELQDKSSIKSTADNPGTKIIIYGKYES